MKTIIENLGSVTEKRNFMYDNGNSHYSVLGLDVRIFSRNECFLGNVEYIFTDSKIGNKAIPSTFIKFIGQEEIEVKYSGLFKAEIFLNDEQYINYINNKIEVLTKEQIKGYFSQLEKKNYIMICEGQICPAGEVDFLTDYEF
jgi:hypothetical protein